MNDIIKNTDLKIEKDEYQPCREHNGAHLVRTFTAMNENSYVHVAQEKGQKKMEVVVSHKGKTNLPPERLSKENAMQYILSRLSE